MKRFNVLILFCLAAVGMWAQNGFESSGQASAYSVVSPWQDKKLTTGFRFLPGLRYHGKAREVQLDAEVSAHLFAHEAIFPLDDQPTAGLQPYRFWVRLADSTRSLRIGLQQINFGSATILRPLMWFDRVNPLDPLSLTEGVWSALGQVYFKNNANLWLWVNLPSDKLRVWDIFPSSLRFPEAGGRIQWPVTKGEMGVAANFRAVEMPDSQIQLTGHEHALQYKIGVDGRWDVGPGLWYECSFTGSDRNLGPYSQLVLLTLGADYTFGLGNGLNLTAEHMWAAMGSCINYMDESAAFSALSSSYPINFFNQFRLMAYYDWKHRKPYTFLQYENSLSKGKLQLMAWANPENPVLPGREDMMLFGGLGIQIMYIVHF
jgi:hypothetical protein